MTTAKLYPFYVTTTAMQLITVSGPAKWTDTEVTFPIGENGSTFTAKRAELGKTFSTKRAAKTWLRRMGRTF